MMGYCKTTDAYLEFGFIPFGIVKKCHNLNGSTPPIAQVGEVDKNKVLFNFMSEFISPHQCEVFVNAPLECLVGMDG